ncbi:MAG: ATP-binding protein [Bacteroidetes bacterium]|nr:ATP-binding protein [Bacteroidota bacterium]
MIQEINSEQLNLNPNRLYNNPTGWFKDGDTYSPIPAYSKVLDSGIYFIQINEGALAFTKTELSTDEIFEIGNTISDKVLISLDNFWAKESEIKKGGITYKRGFLFHGKPGCGKTTLLNQISQHLIQRDGIVIVGSEPNLTIEALTQLRRIEPTRKLAVLWEDFEGFLNGFGEENLLSLFDGQRQVDNVIHICTTNYLDDIPHRFKSRPSRIDEVIEIEPPTEEARLIFLAKLFKKYDKEFFDGDYWLKDTEGMPFAHIKELFISVKILDYDYKTTLERLKSNINQNDSDGSGVFGKD